MKKMTMMVMVMLVAGMTQAASVAWSTGAIKVPTAPTGAFGVNAGATTGIYNAIVSFYLDSAGSQGALIATVTGNTDNSTSALSVLNGSTGTFSFGQSTKYWAQVYVTSTASGGGWSMTSTMASFTVPPSGSANINFLTGTGFDVVSNKMPAAWAPEPTSMALLALGAAAVGLRRRTRK